MKADIRPARRSPAVARAPRLGVGDRRLALLSPRRSMGGERAALARHASGSRGAHAARMGLVRAGVAAGRCAGLSALGRLAARLAERAVPARADVEPLIERRRAAPRLRAHRRADQPARRPARRAARDVAAQVREASRSVEEESNRLAALMAELTQSVVVCNLDGRILLYNSPRPRSSGAVERPSVAGGGELIGLGRSIYMVRPRPRRMRWRTSSSACARRGAADGAVRHRHARGPVAARADGAGVGRAASTPRPARCRSTASC